MNAKPLQVWLVDDDASIRWVLEKALKGSGMVAKSFDQVDNVLSALRGDAPDVLMTDIRMPGRSGLDLLKEIQNSRPGLPVIVMTAHSDLDAAVAAYQGGAFEYLPKPFDIDKAVDLVRRAAQQATISIDVEAARRSIPELLGQAAAMQQVFRAVGRLSRSSMTVLITGESGTGKELVARALHRHSPRSNKAFVALNTAAFTADLLESELFGHEKGAFTGADALRRGRFEQADGGTLFLDEIGDMSPALQTRLLRVLAEGEFYRVGGQTPVKVDVRVIAATHQDLETRVKSGHFREDLLHRLNVIRIEIPPLRERREDIPELLRHYLSVAGQELGVEPKLLMPTAETALVTFDWPGNVRQLVNACRRLTVTAPGREIRAEDIPPDLGGVAAGHTVSHDWTAKLSHWAEQELDAGTQRLLDRAVPEVERILIRVALRKADGLKQDAAKLLGWGRNTLTRKMKELGMEDVSYARNRPQRFIIRSLMGDFLTLKIGAAERLLLSNSLGDWLLAGGVAVAVWSGLWILRQFVASRYKRYSTAKHPTAIRLIAYLVGNTKQYLFLAIALDVSQESLTLPQKVHHFVASLVMVLILLQVGLWAGRTVRFYLEIKELERGADRIFVGSLDIISFVARMLIWSLLVLVALDNLGVNITALLAGLGVGGVAVALALQNVLGDLFASLSIALDKPFVVGDRLVIDTFGGAVEHIGIKTTRLRSDTGEQIILSNADILKSRVRNFGRAQEQRALATLRVNYDTPGDKLQGIPKLLETIVREQAHARFDRCHLKSLDESFLQFELSYFVQQPSLNPLLDLQQAVNFRILEEFRRLGIEFAYPMQRVVLDRIALEK